MIKMRSDKTDVICYVNPMHVVACFNRGERAMVRTVDGYRYYADDPDLDKLALIVKKGQMERL